MPRGTGDGAAAPTPDIEQGRLRWPGKGILTGAGGERANDGAIAAITPLPPPSPTR